MDGKIGSRGRDLLNDSTVTTVIVGAVAAGLSMLLGKLTGFVGYGVMLGCLIFSLIVLLVDLWIVARFASGRIAERLGMLDEHFVATLTAAEQHLLERLDRTDSLLTLRGVTLKTQAEVMEYEKVSVTKDVWIVSAGLNDELRDEIIRVIVGNLERGVRYVYIIPDDPVVIERVRKIKRACGSHDRVVWFHMPAEFFNLVPRHDISIYDPSGKTNDQIVAYMNLPARGAPSNLFVLLEGDYAIGIFRSVIPSARKAKVMPKS